jgi:hypothetical protein
VILLDERLQVDCDHHTRIEDMQSLHVRLPTLNNQANWLNGRRSYRPLDLRIKINRLQAATIRPFFQQARSFDGIPEKRLS